MFELVNDDNIVHYDTIILNEESDYEYIIEITGLDYVKHRIIIKCTNKQEAIKMALQKFKSNDIEIGWDMQVVMQLLHKTKEKIF